MCVCVYMYVCVCVCVCVYVCVCMCICIQRRFVVIFVVIDNKRTSNSLKKTICETHLSEQFEEII